jgi:hypothetical protein
MKRKILFVFFFAAFVVVGGAVFINNDVSSQSNPLLSNYGRACMNNYPDCPGGYKNLVQGVLREEINLYGMTADNLYSSIRRGYGITQDQLNKLCIREELTDIVPRVGFPSNSLPSYDDNLRPVACPGGWEPQQALNSSALINIPVLGGIGGSSQAPWGCCPTGYQFVNQEREFLGSIEAVQQGFCCRTDGGSPTTADMRGDVQGCLNSSGQHIYTLNDAVPLSALINNDPTVSPESLTEQDVYRLLEGSPIIVGVVGLPQGVTNADFPITNNYGDSANPQLGIALGSSFSSNNPADGRRILTGANENLPGLSCPNTGCSVFNFSGVAEVDSDLGTFILEPGSLNRGDFLVGRTEDIIDFAAENNVAPACTRCYNTGEAIAVEEDNVLICNPANASGGYVDKRPLVNGNIRDTLAVYTSQPGVNLENSIRCIEQGGIYTAIGCIDPTPVGILTGLIRISLGVVGGVALIQLILAGLAYQSGNEESIQKARARIFATIGGLAFLIFSVLILRIIGVNVLDVVPAELF